MQLSSWMWFLACHDFPLIITTVSILFYFYFLFRAVMHCSMTTWTRTSQFSSHKIHKTLSTGYIAYITVIVPRAIQVFSFFRAYKLHDNVQNLYTIPINLSFFTLSINEISVLLTIFFSNLNMWFLVDIVVWCIWLF